MHTRDSACEQGHSSCSSRPQADASRKDTPATNARGDITSRDLGERVAIEEGALDQARHCGAPAKVLGHRNDGHADVHLILR